MNFRSGTLRRNLLQATFLSTSLMAGGMPYARAQSCGPAACTIYSGRAQIRVDGKAGSGLPGGNTSILNSGTQGDLAMYAIANGGSGGTGSNADWWDDDQAGTGGTGGNGGEANIKNLPGSVIVVAPGATYHGVYAVGVGGTGGNGGEGDFTYNGGKGGVGGRGGTITITSNATVTVGQAGGNGLFGVATGGAGGVGGVKGDSSRPGVSGNGGEGGTVSITNVGAVTISNPASAAIVAIGVGGAGGNGIGYQNKNTYYSYAGNGGNGGGAASIGTGGIAQGSAVNFQQAAVAVKNTGTLTSAGSGIVVSAAGGRGGNVGWYSIQPGGTGGKGGTAYAYHSGTITVSGDGIASAPAGGVVVIAAGGAGGQGGYHSEQTPQAYGTTYYGGVGGQGGNGGIASIVIAAGSTVTSTGTLAPAILANANGGVGGPAGFGNGYTSAGGAGGKGGTATVVASGTLQTNGANSAAVVVTAVGGNAGSLEQNWPYTISGYSGGNGGTASATVTFAPLAAGQVTTSGANSDAVLVDASGGLGGAGKNGGGGGNGGSASARVYGQIVVTGDGSNGISVLSAGGNGGVSNKDPSGNKGTGGAGGNGGTAYLRNEASIAATGNNAVGIYVSTSGGHSGTGSLLADKIDAGNGGDATVKSYGSVTMTNTGSTRGIYVNTQGGWAFQYGSDGLIAQTTGAGGNGGNATVTIGASVATVGASGSNAVLVNASGGRGGTGATYTKYAPVGAGGNSGNITLTVNPGSTGYSRISTTGSNSAAILLIANGGYGGTGVNWSSDYTGGGGAGGSAGAIDVTIGAGVTIVTAGPQSAGISANSVGGQGGYSAGLRGDDEEFIGFGGDGGNGGAAGTISIKNYGSILTLGNQSSGIVAISGGGNGGMAGVGKQAGAGGTGVTQGYAVSVSNAGAIVTIGSQSYGIKVASTGGNGYSGSVLGTPDEATPGAGAPSGNVQVLNSGSITTAGSKSHGIVALSVGGGGGAGSTSTTSGLGITVTGGAGGSGANAGTTNLVNSGAIKTYGDGANGIFASSMGGGGGAGASVTGSGAPLAVASIGVTIGGKGGSGATGGVVEVTNNAGGDIVTHGADAAAIHVLSTGGAGGNGGQADSSSYAFGFGEVSSFQFHIDIAGSGGTGGDGGTITVYNVGTIVTYGDNSQGVVATSVGGGGGEGGNAIAQSLSYGLSENASIAITMGGSGGSGGDGGAVTLNNTNTADPSFTGKASITTYGFGSDALSAVSVGGGGGAGGIGKSEVQTEMPFQSEIGFLPLAFTESYSVNLTLGGAGGSGGKGGDVTVTNDYQLATFGIDSVGIFAQSVGGGGGKAAAGKATSSQDMTATFTLGGNGGNGGNGGTVTVTNTSTGTISTSADGAHGMFVQSIGGGGGAGGTATADTESSEKTQGEQALSQAMIAKLTDYYVKELLDGIVESNYSPTVQLTITLGGSGGAGGNGGVVKVYNDGSIVTGASGGSGGDLAMGIIAQSVGGGGGHAGSAAVSGARIIDTSVTLGGSGGAFGYGNAVGVYSSGSVTTNGDSAFGVLAQSIGGGGGIAGLSTSKGTIEYSPIIQIGGSIGGSTPSSSAGGAVTVSVADVTTHGEEAHGVVAQSIGGGGGVFYVNPSDQQDVGQLAYQKEIAAAVVAEVGQAEVDAAIAAFNAALANSSGTVVLNIGGKGDISGGGSGGTVSVTNTGSITTSGADAFGIIAQSIGGGGGLHTDGTGVDVNTLTVKGYLGNQTSGSVPQAGGSLTVTLDGGSSITTTGVGATAILAQSIGGGGGYTGALDSTSMSYQTFLSATGNAMVVSDNTAGGDVIISTQGAGASIITTGANAHGIFAQSLSGGGGVVANQDGIIAPESANSESRHLSIDNGFTPGTITINYTGTLKTTGFDSIAIFAQSGVQTTSGMADRSYGTQTSGDITVTIGANSTVVGGYDGGKAIVLDGGATNTILIEDGASVSSLSNVTIVVPWGTPNLTNQGSLSGDIYLGTTSLSSPTVVFTNAPGGYYQSTGAAPGNGSVGTGSIYLGNNGQMSNAGYFNIGGTGTIATATVTGTFADTLADGAFTQTESGTLQIDVRGANAAQGIALGNDQLAMSSAGSISGEAKVNVMGSINPSDRFVVLTTDHYTAGVNDMQAATPDLLFSTDSHGGPTITWGEIYYEHALVIYAQKIDFTPAGTALNPNQAAYAQHLQATWDAGGSDTLSPVYAELVNLPNGASYQRALGTAMPAIMATGPLSRVAATRAELTSVLSCPEFEATGTLLVQGDCAWARVDGSNTRFTPGDYTGFDLNTVTYRMGAQKEFAPGWFMGLAAAYSTDWGDNEFGYSSSTGQGVGLSASLKHELGPWLISGAASFGYGRYDATRQTVVGAATYLSDAAYEVFSAAGRLRAEYQIPLDAWYLKPFGQIDLIYVNVPGYNEGGHLSPYDLAIAQSDNFSVAIGPHLEVGARVNLSDGSVLRPFATAGVTWYSDNSWTVVSALQGAPASVGTFSSTVALPDVLADVGLGLQWSSKDNIDLKATYEAEIGSNFLSQTGSVRFSVRF